MYKLWKKKTSCKVNYKFKNLFMRVSWNFYWWQKLIQAWIRLISNNNLEWKVMAKYVPFRMILKVKQRFIWRKNERRWYNEYMKYKSLKKIKDFHAVC